MIEVTNTLFQPLTLQTTSGVGMHLSPRGRLQISESDISEEMRRAARRGFIRLQQATAVLPGLSEDNAVSGKAGKRKES